MCPNESKIEVRGKSTRDPILCVPFACKACRILRRLDAACETLTMSVALGFGL